MITDSPDAVFTRLARDEDAEALASLVGALAHEAPGQEIHANNLQGILASSRDRLWVMEGNAELLGYLHAIYSTRLASSPFIEIVGLVVSASARRRGLATQLLSQAESWARELGMTLRVRCREDREQGNEFYQALGFELTKRQNVYEKSILPG